MFCFFGENKKMNNIVKNTKNILDLESFIRYLKDNFISIRNIKKSNEDIGFEIEPFICNDEELYYIYFKLNNIQFLVESDYNSLLFILLKYMTIIDNMNLNISIRNIYLLSLFNYLLEVYGFESKFDLLNEYDLAVQILHLNDSTINRDNIDNSFVSHLKA